MAAKKKRKAAAPRKPKKRAGRPVKKKNPRPSPRVGLRGTNNPPPPPLRPSQPPAMDWGNSFEAAAQIATRRRVLPTVDVFDTPLPLRIVPPVMPQPDLA